MTDAPDRIGHEELRALATAALVRAGVPEADARLVADSAVDADLGGRASHGVVRIAGYIAKVRKGGIDPSVRPELVHAFGATFTLDARDGFGQVALAEAVERCVGLARVHGVATGAIRRLNNAGALGYFARQAAAQGQLAILACNATPAMPPHGGRTAALGTNPLCIAVPVRDGSPPVLDMATSAASKGVIRQAARAGRPIPADWALGPDGNPTTDASQALAGVLLPFGGAKGSGLALMVEVLAGVMSGAGFGGDVRPLNDAAAPSGAGGFVLTIDPQAFLPLDEFHDRMAAFLSGIRANPAARGVERVQAPGDAYWTRRERGLIDGIELPAEVLRELRELAAPGGG